LLDNGHDVVALAKRANHINGISIQTEFPDNKDIHTVTMYIGAPHQPEYYEPILKLRPRRVIFNPGAENPELYNKLEREGIEAIEACTLVMLATSQY
jgi:predicted CoA-binding protein